MRIISVVNQRWSPTSPRPQASDLASDLPGHLSGLVDVFVYPRLYASCRIRAAVFETYLDSFPCEVLMLLPAGRQCSACSQAHGRLLTESVSAFADLETRMGLSTACGAFLLPTLTDGLLNLRLGRSGGSEANEPRFIRLLDGALGMNAAQRVGWFSANRA